MKKKNLKKMKKQIAGALTVLFLAIAQFVYTEYFAPKPSSPERQIVTLDKCVDGDTAWFKISGERVKSRFLYIDTPESTNKKDETVKTETKKNTQKSKVKTGDNTAITAFAVMMFISGCVFVLARRKRND